MLSRRSDAGGEMPRRPWPADQSERWPIEHLIPYAHNARLHSEADLDKIAASPRVAVTSTTRWPCAFAFIITPPVEIASSSG